MKNIIFIFTIIISLISCSPHKEKGVKEKAVNNPDSTILTKTIYSKDSSFFKVVPLKENDTLAPYTIYMIYKGSYHIVHEKAGGDILFIYTDSTKSRYVYDRRGKHFLKGEERNKYFHLLSGK